MRPFLKWAGGKYRLREKILDILPPGKRLIEPFVGSGAIFLNTNYTDYLLADKNADLISLYHFLQKEGQVFIDDCQEYFKPENNTAAQYALLRDTFNATLNKAREERRRAMLFVYLNRHCFNGLCRYNSKGIFNVPFGRYTSLKLPTELMQLFHQKSQRATFQCIGFEETLKQAQKGDVIYCDPPYVPFSDSARLFGYVKDIFTAHQQADLAQLAEKLHVKKGIPVIISNHDTPETRQYYHAAKLIAFDTRRWISATTRNKAAELLAVYDNATILPGVVLKIQQSLQR